MCVISSTSLYADHIYRCNFKEWIYTDVKGIDKAMDEKYSPYQSFDFGHFGDYIKDGRGDTYSYLRNQNKYSLFKVDEDEWVDDTIYISERDRTNVMIIRHNDDGAANTWRFKCSVEYVERVIFK